VVVEVKSVAHLLSIVEGQLITCLRVTRKRVGLLINVNTPLVTEGIIRRVL
jgi:GxxExxY protein